MARFLLAILSLLVALPAAAREEAGLPRAALVAGAPLPPDRAELAALRQKLAAGYALLDDPALQRELERLDHPAGPMQIVRDAIKEALARMRRLALDEVQRTLEEAEPSVQQLPPTPEGRELLCALALRQAHASLLLGNTGAAAEALQRGLSAAPDFTLDQALEPPDLVQLFDRVRQSIREAPRTQLFITSTPPGATVVISGVPHGPAPQRVTVPAGVAVVVWAVQDGFLPRNVTAHVPPPAQPPADGKPEAGPEARPAARPGALAVDIQLEPRPLVAQAQSLVQALREGPPLTRAATARGLAQLLHTDAIVVAARGPGGRPRLHVYGVPPRFPATSPVPATLDLAVESPPAQRHGLPPWFWGVVGVVAGGAVATGISLGVLLRGGPQ